MKPTVLVATTDRWFPTARLAMALAQAGCIVDAVCPSGHPMQKTSAVRTMHPYRGLMPVSSFEDAIRSSRPDMIIPGDDLATWHLHDLWEGGNGQETESWISELITRSLGAPESFPIAKSRTSFMELAERLGVRVPRTGVISGLDDLRRWTAASGFPVVLKANCTSGGDGVRVARSMEEAERAFQKLQSPPLVARALKRAVVDADTTLIGPSFSRRRSIVNAQGFVAGHEANSTVACWRGTVMACLHFEVLQKRHASGPATVVRAIDHPEMSAATETMVKQLNLSGIHGFDFMIEDETGYAYLIEINPRTTQVGHLALGERHDLPAALYGILTGRETPAAKITDNDTVALFPHEWMRDPSSPFLSSAFHDIPWEEPELVTACILKVQKQSRQHLSEKRSRPERRLLAPLHNRQVPPGDTGWIPERTKSQYE